MGAFVGGMYYAMWYAGWQSIFVWFEQYLGMVIP
jgi:hypothetical protein